MIERTSYWEGALMDFEDDFFDECEDCSAGSFADYDFQERQNGNEDELNPFNLRDPETTYFLFSDDVQEIAESTKSQVEMSAVRI
jgi:hypothetical protein